MIIYKLSDASSLLAPSRYLAEVRASLKRIEEILESAEGFRQMDARCRLRNLAESADSVCGELIRTALTKVQA